MGAFNQGNSEAALRFMEESAQAGDSSACYMAALWNQNGDGTPASLSRRDYWMRQIILLAERGDLEAQWELSSCCRWGDLLPTDIEQANYWLERAAAGGNGEAQHHLAWYYETGQYDYPVSPHEASRWYDCAFAQGNPETIYVYALGAYVDGQPSEESLLLLTRAAEAGFKPAIDLLQEIESQSRP